MGNESKFQMAESRLRRDGIDEWLLLVGQFWQKSGQDSRNAGSSGTFDNSFFLKEKGSFNLKMK